MTELKPCPFCGGKAHIVSDYSSEHDKTRWNLWHECEGHEGGSVSYGHALHPWFETPWYDTEAEAAEAWNTRVDPYDVYEGMKPMTEENLKPLGWVRERTCRFVDDSDGEFPPKCSACGYEPSVYECSWLCDGGYEYEGNYCPNCGALVMEVEQ